MRSTSQSTDRILMIRPVNFAFNEETAVNNAFQVKSGDSSHKTQTDALKEFDGLVQLLRDHRIHVTVVNDTAEPYTPDSIFPNNIVSFHEDGRVCKFPVFAPNRRGERKETVLTEIRKHFRVTSIVDLTHFENKNKFLEGTGSLILDHVNKNVFACLSPRTDLDVVTEFCEVMGYATGNIVIFRATDANGKDIYHTNVMMSLGDQYALVCLECIPSVEERTHLMDTLKKSSKDVIEISVEQMNQFAGNMLQVKNIDGEKFLVMSTRAYEALEDHQIKRLKTYNRIIHTKLNTIENTGGGSARCMLAEIFLPKKELKC